MTPYILLVAVCAAYLVFTLHATKQKRIQERLDSPEGRVYRTAVFRKEEERF